MNTLEMFLLKGKVALVTGGAGLYGRQIVTALAEAGAKTYVASRNLEVLEKLVNSGVDHDCKALGAYYVLGCLTIVNETAATSLPWLFQSVSYY